MPSGVMPDFALLRVSTAALTPRERLAFSREVFGRKLVKLDIEPLSGEKLQHLVGAAMNVTPNVAETLRRIFRK